MKPSFARLARKDSVTFVAQTILYFACALGAAAQAPPAPPPLEPSPFGAPVPGLPPLPATDPGAATGLPPLPPTGSEVPPLTDPVLPPLPAPGSPALPALPGGPDPVAPPPAAPGPLAPPPPAPVPADPAAPVAPVDPVPPVDPAPIDPVTPADPAPAAVADPVEIPDPVPPAGLRIPPVSDNAALLRLLDEIRNRSGRGDYAGAQGIAKAALETIAENAENAFYLRQVRREQTNLYFRLANQAMKDRKYSLASQYLARYRENVARDLEDRKQARAAGLGGGSTGDASLVGKLVRDLDQAKKDLAEIRAKSGLPLSDAQADEDKAMREQRRQLELQRARADRLLTKARTDAADGQYDLADDQLDEALANLPRSVATIALISDLFKAKKQVIWYRMGEAMQKGQAEEMQDLTLEFQHVEKKRREAEQEMGMTEEPDLDAKLRVAQEEVRRKIRIAETLLAQARGHLKRENFAAASTLLKQIFDHLPPSTPNQPYLEKAAILKHQITLRQAEQLLREQKWDRAAQQAEAYIEGIKKEPYLVGDRRNLSEIPGMAEDQDDLRDKLDRLTKPGERMLERIQEDKRNPSKRDITEFTPSWNERQEELRELLMRAKVQFIAHDLTGATETYRYIESRFPENYEAKSMLRRISILRQEESYLGYLQTRESMLEEISREWERPKVFERVIDEVLPPDTEVNQIKSVLDTVIPPVDYFNTPLPEVMSDLMRRVAQVRQNLPEVLDGSEPRGVNIIVMNPDNVPIPNLPRLSLQEMKLGRMIEFITDMVGWNFDVRQDAVLITKGGNINNIFLETEDFNLNQVTIQRMTGNLGGGAAPGAGGNPFAPPAGGGAAPPGGDLGVKIQEYFTKAGIPFDENKGHRLVFDGVQLLLVTHERRYLDKIQRILRRFDDNAFQQIEIETKFLEVQEGALDEISFDWQMKWGNPVPSVDPITGMPQIDARGRPVMVYEKNFHGNTRTLATAHSPGGIDRDIRITFPDNPDSDRIIPNPTPSLPGKVGIGTGVAPLLDFTQNIIMGQRQATLLVNALQRKQGTDLLCAPRVTTMDKVEATITVAQEFIYPITYDPPQLGGGGGGGGGGGLGGGIGGGITLQPGNPTFNKVHPSDDPADAGFREVGVVLNVNPEILPQYDAIRMELRPTVTEFDGFVEYGGQMAMIGTGFATPTVIQPSGNLMPIFSVRKVETTVTVFDGATIIIGGLTREEVRTVNDKIPFLGNVPLIGRFFQSNAESYSKRNLLIFVSASIVSPGGSPVRETIQNIGPQSIFEDPVIMTPTGNIRRAFTGVLD